MVDSTAKSIQILMRKNLLIFLLLCLLTMGAQAQLKPRVVILTDIGQPDSRQSEVLYGFLNVTLFSCN